jgi:glucose/arabinose dehydrogenase
VASRRPIDRKIVEYPDGFQLETFMTNLTCPTGMCFDDATGALIVAEGGIDGRDPRIFAIRPDKTIQWIYPVGTRIPIVEPGFRIYGPVGGIIAWRGKIYVSHRDANDMGVITQFDYNGNHKTIIAGLPAQGDYGVTDLAISPPPLEPRLYFGMGAATNSGVVGLDNWEEGWVRTHRQACDVPYQQVNLWGFRFDVPNPEASIFSPSSLVTVPFQPLGKSDVLSIPGAQFPIQKPTGAIMSVALDGGDPKLEAWGVRDPAGLLIDPEFGGIYVTDQGMELRGTRPVDKDPDALYELSGEPGLWLGFPDYSRIFEPIDLPKYQPESWMLAGTGYPSISFVIDHEKSHLNAPDAGQLVKAQFDWQSGAGKMAQIPKTGPFHIPKYDGQILVAMWGDRAPFSTSGRPIPAPWPGYRIGRVDPNSHTVSGFIFNTLGGPASELSDGRGQGIERPVDVKFSPDGQALYVLDFGKAVYKHGHLQAESGTGKIFVLVPAGNAAGK